VSLAVGPTAIATVDDPAAQVIFACQEDLPVPAECAFLPYLASASETWLAALREFPCLPGTVMLETSGSLA